MNFTATRAAAKSAPEGKKARSILRQNADPHGKKDSHTGGNQKGRK
jgi:hypothetical protein